VRSKFADSHPGNGERVERTFFEEMEATPIVRTPLADGKASTDFQAVARRPYERLRFSALEPFERAALTLVAPELM
jgi:hypothetical protein